MMDHNQPRMMTVREIARTGVLPESTLRALLKSGKLPAIYVGNRALINYDKLCYALQQLNADLMCGQERKAEENN